MLMVSFRLSPRRILLGTLVLAVAAGIVVSGVRLLAGRDTIALAAPASEGKTEQVKPRKVKAKTNEERVAFAQSFGWEVGPDPVEVLEVIIPEEFDEVYANYNSIQKKQGFNLEKYAGKRVKRYSYIVTNYPGVDAEVRFNILVQNNRIIGGDVSSLEAGGFMHGFEINET